MFCPQCGKQTDVGDSFCSSCGHNLRAGATTPAVTTPCQTGAAKPGNVPLTPFMSGMRTSGRITGGFIRSQRRMPASLKLLVVLGGVSLFALLTYGGILYLTRHSDRSSMPRSSPSAPNPVGPLSQQEAGSMLLSAKAQIAQRNYLAAQSTLNTIQKRVAANSSQETEATRLLSQINALATRQALRKKKQAEALQREEQAHHFMRNVFGHELEEELVRAGFDVRVGLVTSNAATDNRNLLIKGDSVKRVFARQLMQPVLIRRMKGLGFTKVTFMNNDFAGWIAEYDLQAGTYRD